ncbi:NAD(P)/FAD-dependent oxidoreductase [Roseomonas marmotae]|uniref:FAD-dependent monooxygenase n=1 Tax=Roseomonas marmotae TaxID=2768161 RepID=A0ABS3K778_9PROT|nr:FAD-dependent oxidoreductase [Roseomonas marmotae]MBO1073314.1 FAD-dependent monooxygenase [Roseomonas marmotae]QTI79069.1 FAD-dependent monooxygenase [Roseomonas marmotae]
MPGPHDALVIGGGIAGAALARQLAAAGRDVLLVERQEQEHDKVCGEFLSGEAAFYLRQLGLDPLALGALRVEGVALARHGEALHHSLPFPALSLSRRRLDEAMLTHAASAGAALRRGAGARELRRQGALWQARLEDGGVVEGREVFLATGKHDLRGWRRPPGRQPDLLGFKLHLRLRPGQAAALGRSVEIGLFPGGYAGLQPVENGRVNLCLLVRQQTFAGLGRQWPALLAHIAAHCPHLAHRLEGCGAERQRPLAIAAIPYGFVQRQGDGCWRLGDQAAVIPSFAGEGMSIALHSARLAAACHLGGQDAAAYQRLLARDVSALVGRATLLSRLMVSERGQALIMGASRALPRLLAVAALLTRLPAPALRRCGLDPAEALAHTA